MIKPSFDLIKECKDAKKIVVTGHIKPDGDCIGSTVATTLYLKKCLPEAEVRLLLEHPLPCFDEVKGIDIIDSNYGGNPDETDICIVLDTNAGRIGSAEPFFEKAKKTINIDHHFSNAEGSAMLNYIDPEASSASEMVYRMIPKEVLDADIAMYLYIGITHDTGVFRYNSTSKETHLAAAELITYDFNFSEILEKTYYEKTYEQVINIAGIVEKAEQYFDGKVIFGSVSYQEYTERKLTPADFDGAINELRIIKGCECAIFMYPMNEVTYKVSMRSIGTVNVANICELFGGGGHVRAAGFFKKAGLEELRNQILAAIAEQTGWK